MKPLPLILVALLAAGCGGSGQLATPRSNTARLTVGSAWPKGQGRVVPTAAQSIRVQVLQGATVVNDAILTPASPTTTFAEVPVGSLTVKAVAYPQTNGTGTPMASSQVPKTVASNENASVDLTMVSTIDRLVVTPNPFTLLHLVLNQQLTVTAYDAGNAVVLMDPSDVTYTSSNTSLATVNATGLVVAVGVGNATITATDRISGKSGSTSASILSL